MRPPDDSSPVFDKDGNLRGFFKFARNWADQHQFLLAGLILVISTAPFISVLGDPPQSDVHLYYRVARGIAQGVLPYRDGVLEYPPYAILIFLLPKLLGGENYTIGFKLLVFVADAIIKCLLFAVGLREAKGIRSLLPLASYSIALPFMRFFFLQRYDVFPAIISVAALWLFCSRRYALSGLMIALGAGIKLYPALFAPALLVLAWRKHQGKQFFVGLVGGAVPILLLSFLLPWWRFLAFHSARGLQAESLYSSLLWFSHFAGIADVRWEAGERCFEVHGAVADMILPWSRAWFVGIVGLSCILACRA